MQEEGGSLLNYSQSELVAVLTVTQELPANLVELIAKRYGNAFVAFRFPFLPLLT